jgi:hypothetical protein
VPDTLEAITVFMLAVAPGFLAVRGFSRRRYRTVPDRDLYALAAAAVISAVWLGLVWLALLSFGDPLKAWGILPTDSKLLADHRADAVLLALGVIWTPYVIGILFAAALDRVELTKNEWLWRQMRRAGFFRAPTAWDRGWSRFRRKRGGVGNVMISLKSGLVIRGGFGSSSQVDLSPNPAQVYLEQGFGYWADDDGKISRLDGDGPGGVIVRGDDIRAVYFLDRIDLEEEIPSSDEPQPKEVLDGPAEDSGGSATSESPPSLSV